MALPDRKFSAGSEYRFGYNGKENDSETGTQDYGMRIYDGRMAKFLSVDPISTEYPWYSPYQFSGNNPVQFVDIDGLEPGRRTAIRRHRIRRGNFQGGGLISIFGGTKGKYFRHRSLDLNTKPKNKVEATLKKDGSESDESAYTGKPKEKDFTTTDPNPGKTTDNGAEKPVLDNSTPDEKPDNQEEKEAAEPKLKNEEPEERVFKPGIITELEDTPENRAMFKDYADKEKARILKSGKYDKYDFDIDKHIEWGNPDAKKTKSTSFFLREYTDDAREILKKRADEKK